MKIPTLFATAMVSAWMLTACYNPSTDGGRSDADGNYHPAYPEAYSDGRQAAAEMKKSCTDTTQVQDFLLELNARAFNIETQQCKGAAVDYRQGIVDYITEHDPSLAEKIFN